MPPISRNQPQLSEEIAQTYTGETLQPEADTALGTVQRDLIDVTADQIADSYTTLEETRLHASLRNAAVLDADALSQIALNFDVLRAPATKATGVVTFYSRSAPTFDVGIPAGTVVQTTPLDNGSVVRYVTTAVATLRVGTTANPLTGFYEVDALVEAETAGTAYNVGSNTLTVMPSRITGIYGVVNTDPINNATDADDNETVAASIRAKTAGSDLATPSGYVRLITTGFTNNVSSVAVVGPYDDDNERVEFFNEVDVALISAVDAESFTTILTTSGDSKTYFGNERPVVSVLSVVGTTNGVNYVSGTHYGFSRDTGPVFGYSSRSFDALTWFPAHRLGPGVNVTVQGTRYSMVRRVQDFLDDSTRRYVTADLLVREAQPIYIDVSAAVAADSGVDRTQLASDIRSAITTALAAYEQGDDVLEDDVVEIINAVEGVQSVDVPLAVFRKSTESTNANDTIDIRAQEYARAGTLTITVS